MRHLVHMHAYSIGDRGHPCITDILKSNGSVKRNIDLYSATCFCIHPSYPTNKPWPKTIDLHTGVMYQDINIFIIDGFVGVFCQCPYCVCLSPSLSPLHQQAEWSPGVPTYHHPPRDCPDWLLWEGLGIKAGDILRVCSLPALPPPTWLLTIDINVCCVVLCCVIV